MGRLRINVFGQRYSLSRAMAGGGGFLPVYLLATVLTALASFREVDAATPPDEFGKSLEVIISAASDAGVRIDRGEVIALLRRFDSLDFAEGQLDAAGLPWLQQRYAYLDEAGFYESAPELALAFRDVAIALHARGHTSVVLHPERPADDVLVRAYWRLVAARLFHAAQAHAEQFGLGDLKQFSGPGTRPPDTARPSVLRSSGGEGNYRLERVSVDLHDAPLVIAVVHPGCGFSRAAMTWVENNAAEFLRFGSRIHWVAPQVHLEDLERLADWNVSAQVTKVNVMDDEAAWPAELRFNATPVFHLVRDGRRVDRISGWMSDDAGEVLLRAISAHLDGAARRSDATAQATGADLPTG